MANWIRKKSDIKITLNTSQEDANIIQVDIQAIADRLTAEEIRLLAKAVKNPIIKAAALRELKNLS